MEQISAMLIDDHDDSRRVLKDFLTSNEILVSGSFTHDQFLKQKELQKIPDIVIVIHDTPQFVSELNVTYLRRQYPLLKILVSADFKNRESISRAIGRDIDGLVFKNGKNSQQILKAVYALKKNGKYFEVII
jgi:DNA-binding NarL/FixJ family response regulator